MIDLDLGTLAPHTETVQITAGGEALRFELRRPSRRGLAAIAGRIADAYSSTMLPGLLVERDGRGIEMDAILAEYISGAPDRFLAKNGQGKPEKSDTGRPVLNLDAIPVEVYAALGGACLDWHESFRAGDVHFRPQQGEAARPEG